MKRQTSPEQRYEFYERHQAGESYQAIAQRYGVSKECVRYWCRRQRDGGGCHNQYSRASKGILSQFAPIIRYAILRLKLEHARWGPSRIRYHLQRRASLRYKRLPKEAAIGRYLHQWPCFGRQGHQQAAQRDRPQRPSQVHQQWQIDFKTDVELQDGSRVVLHTIRDPVGEACLAAVVFPLSKAQQRSERVTLPQVRTVLRRCFAHWQTLPDEIQTDGEIVLGNNGQDAFPSLFTLWLVGLGIEHRVIRSGQPTDNAEVERCHRTLNEYAIIGNEDNLCHQLQSILDQALFELLYELPSWAQGCQGQPPIVAHPQLLQPRRPFQPEHELVHFDLDRVDTFLSTFCWSRKADQNGSVSLGGRQHRYSLGRPLARQPLLIRFDPTDRHFVFALPDQPDQSVARRPARHLDVADLTGLSTWPAGLLPQQLPLPFLKG